MTSKHAQMVGGLLAAVAAGLGGLALVAWEFNALTVAALGPDYVPMAPLTAVLFVLLGGLLAWRCFQAETDALDPRLVWGGAVVTAVVCGLELAQAWHGLALPWQGWMIGETTHIGGIPLAHMSNLTAVSFLLVAAGLVLKTVGWEQHVPPLAVGLAGLGLLIGLLVVLGYATGSPLGYAEGNVPMALTTGLGFVLLNSALLFSARWWNWLQERAAGLTMDDAHVQPQVPVLRLALVTFGVMLLLGLAGFVYIRSEVTKARKDAYATLEAVARLKSDQIRQWRGERNAEAQFLMRTEAVAADLARLLARPEDEVSRAHVIDWLSAIQAGERYEAVLVYDAQARLQLALPATAATSIPPAAVTGVLAAGRITQVPIHHTGDASALRLNLLVPIASPQADGRIQAVIDLRLNPEHYLFPLLRSWPVPNDTGEILLLRREADEVVFLNAPRHAPAIGPLALRLSIHDRFYPSTRVAMGETGVIQGRDYRGTPVLATGHAIAGTPWFLVAKMDMAEVLDPIRRETWRSGLLLALLLLAVLAGVVSYWRERHAGALRRSLITERQRNEFAQRLTLLMQQANDIILLLDENWRIVEANQRALETYGYTLAELRALPPGGLRPAGERERHPEQMEQFFTPHGARFETVQVRKDGGLMPVEVSGRAVELDGRRHVLALYRDLTERKAHEAERERMTRLYATLSQINQAIVHATEQTALLRELCRILVDYGRFRMAWIGAPAAASAQIEPLASAGDAAGYLNAIRIFADDRPEGQGPTGRAYRLQATQVCQDISADPRMAPWGELMQRSGFRSSIALPVLRNGQVELVLTAYAAEPDFFGPKEIELLEEAALDVSFGLSNLQREEQRRRIEAELRASELRFRTIFDHAPVGISLTTEERLVLVNAEHARITGVPVEASFELGIFGRVSHPEDYARQQVLAGKFHRGEMGSYTVEKRYLHPDGRVQWAELTSHQYVDPVTQKRVIVTIITDIAERKAYAERMQRQLDELRRWHEATLGREERVMDLKREVNELLARAGQPPRYASAAGESGKDRA